MVVEGGGGEVEVEKISIVSIRPRQILPLINLECVYYENWKIRGYLKKSL